MSGRAAAGAAFVVFAFNASCGDLSLGSLCALPFVFLQQTCGQATQRAALETGPTVAPCAPWAEELDRGSTFYRSCAPGRAELVLQTGTIGPETDLRDRGFAITSFAGGFEGRRDGVVVTCRAARTPEGVRGFTLVVCER